jgi:hypothetical protein
MSDWARRALGDDALEIHAPGRLEHLGAASSSLKLSKTAVY